jgi:hypothetical protein
MIKQIFQSSLGTAADNQFTRTSCFHFRKKRITSVHASAEVSDRRKEFMINHNESDIRRPGIELGSPDSQSSILPCEVTGQLRHQDFWLFKL